MNEFQEADKEVGGESRREVSRTKIAVAESEPQKLTAKEQLAKRSQRAMAKCSCGYTSQGEPRPKKARRGSEAEASMPEVVPSSAEEQEEKEEEEEEEVPTLCS